MIINIKNWHINFDLVSHYYIDDSNIIIVLRNNESITVNCAAMSQAIAIVDKIDLVLGVPRIDTMSSEELNKFIKK